MGKIDMKKIVRVRKLNDIEEFDWEITFEDDTKINHKHEHFFDLIEKGLAQLIKPEPKIENNPEHPHFFAKDPEEEALDIKNPQNKKLIEQFRHDAKTMKVSEFNAKYPSKKIPK